MVTSSFLFHSLKLIMADPVEVYGGQCVLFNRTIKGTALNQFSTAVVNLINITVTALQPVLH